LPIFVSSNTRCLVDAVINPLAEHLTCLLQLFFLERLGDLLADPPDLSDFLDYGVLDALSKSTEGNCCTMGHERLLQFFGSAVAVTISLFDLNS